MNPPTRAEFDDLKEEVRKLKQQQTEPIKIVVEKQIEESPLLQLIYNEVGHLNTKVGTLEQQMKEVKADFLAFRETQADHGEMLKSHGALLVEILNRMPPSE